MKKLFIVICVLWGTQVQAQNGVEPYLQVAVENSPDLKALGEEYKGALEKVQRSGSLMDPRVSLGIFAQPVETRVGPQRLTLGVSQSIPWFGELQSRKDLEKQRAEVVLRLIENAELDLKNKVRVKYEQIFLIDRSISITERKSELLHSLKELARVGFENGTRSFADLLRIEIEEKELASQLQSLKHSQEMLYEEFRLILNSEEAIELDFPDTITVMDLNFERESIDEALANNSLLKSIDETITSKELERDLLEFKSKPSFSVGASYIGIQERKDMAVPQNGKDAFLLPQIGVSIPVFRSKNDASKRQVEFEKQSLLYRKESKSNSLEEAIEMQLYNYLEGKRRTKLNDELMDLTERTISLLQTELTTGKADFQDLLDLERKMLTYQLDIVAAQVQMNKSVYTINYLLGNE